MQNDSVFVCQLLAVSFSLVLVIYDRKKNFKNIAVGVLYVLGIFAVGTVLNRLLFALSTMWRGVAGIHFQIACLLTIVVYLLLFDKTYAASRFTMGATVFITAITMAEFGHELVGYIGATLYCLTIRRWLLLVVYNYIKIQLRMSTFVGRPLFLCYVF